MQTITFYSYKGGTGRTLALANVAVYLSRFGQKVCLLDFDLEAPGLHYKFPSGEESPTQQIQQGLVDYIHQFAVASEVAESLADYSYEVVPEGENRGSIQLIPAGNVLLADYWRKLAEIDWHKLFYTEASEGVPFFLDLKENLLTTLCWLLGMFFFGQFIHVLVPSGGHHTVDFVEPHVDAQAAMCIYLLNKPF